MILLSVGTQIAFDRLVIAVDQWAQKHDRTDIVGQIGPSSYVPKKIKPFSFIGPDEFRRMQKEATVIIAHAGMGSIITALEFGKPIIIMPRDHTRGEHRNAHQIGTAARFANSPGVYVAHDESELIPYLDGLDDLVSHTSASNKAPQAFVNHLRAFIDSDEKPRWWQFFAPRSHLSREKI